MHVRSKGTISAIYIVGQHPFLAHYLLQILTGDGLGKASWIGDRIPLKSRAGQHPLFLLDKCGLDLSVAQYIRAFNSRFDNSKFIVLDERLDIYAVRQFLAWGAHGFLTYSQIPDSLIPAIHSVQDGNTWFDCRVVQKCGAACQPEQPWQSVTQDESLTMREQDTLYLVRQRLSNKEIASLLGIQVSTVKFHLSNIFSKLQIAGRSDLWHAGSAQAAPIPGEEETGPGQMAAGNQERQHSAFYGQTGS